MGNPRRHSNRNMPRPKLKKPEIRDFCEYQAKRGNLEKRVGKEKFVRQAEAEYKVSREGLKILAVFQGEEFQNIRRSVRLVKTNG